MRIAVAAGLGLFLAAGTGLAQISQSARDRIAECGAGLDISSDLTADVTADLEDGRAQLSVGRARAVHAAILSKVGRLNVEPIYAIYVDCITSEESLQALIQQMELRAQDLATLLAAAKVPAREARAVLDLVAAEVSLTKSHQFKGARDKRHEALVQLAAISTQYGIPFAAVSRQATTGWDRLSPREGFREICGRYAPGDPLCRSLATPLHDGPRACTPGEPFCRPS